MTVPALHLPQRRTEDGTVIAWCGRTLTTSPAPGTTTGRNRWCEDCAAAHAFATDREPKGWC